VGASSPGRPLFLMRMGPKLPIIGETTAREAAFLFHARHFAKVCFCPEADLREEQINVRLSGRSRRDADIAECLLMTQSGQPNS